MFGRSFGLFKKPFEIHHTECWAHVQVYDEEAKPVEDFFRGSGLLLDFEITSGIPQTLPALEAALRPYRWRNNSSPRSAVISA